MIGASLVLARRCASTANTSFTRTLISSRPSSLRPGVVRNRLYASGKGNEGLLYAEQRADLLKQWGVYEWSQDADYEATYGVSAPLPPAVGEPVHAVLSDAVGSCRSVQLNRRARANVLDSRTLQLLAGGLLRHGHQLRTASAVVVRARQPGVVSGGNDLAELVGWLRGGASGRAQLLAHARGQLQLANALADLPLPCVAFLNGRVSGAGGLLLHASHVLATELASLHCPDVHAGWLPDAGRTHLLANAPHHAGFYAALTGRPLAAADLVTLGLARHTAPADGAEMLEAAIGSIAEPHIDAFHVALKAAHTALPPAQLTPELLAAIEAAFGTAESLEQVLTRLAQQDTAWSLSTVAAIRRACPLTARLTFDLLRRARGGSLPEALELEDRAMTRLLEERQGAELLEGLQARVEHQREPRWAHQRIEDVRSADIAALLRPTGQPSGYFQPWQNPLVAESRQAVEQMAAALDQVPRVHASERIVARLDMLDETSHLWPAAVEAAAMEDLVHDLRALVREGFITPFEPLTTEQQIATYALEHGLDPWSGTEPTMGSADWQDVLVGPHANALQRMIEYREDDDEGFGKWAELAQMKNDDPTPPDWNELPVSLTNPLADLRKENLIDPSLSFAEMPERLPRKTSEEAHRPARIPNLTYY